VAHFYDTIDQQMITSQQPMMLNSALAFERIIKDPKAGRSSLIFCCLPFVCPCQFFSVYFVVYAAAEAFHTICPCCCFICLSGIPVQLTL